MMQDRITRSNPTVTFYTALNPEFYTALNPEFQLTPLLTKGEVLIFGDSSLTLHSSVNCKSVPCDIGILQNSMEVFREERTTHKNHLNSFSFNTDIHTFFWLKEKAVHVNNIMNLQLRETKAARLVHAKYGKMPKIPELNVQASKPCGFAATAILIAYEKIEENRQNTIDLKTFF